ncbi:hypothetical protein AXF42_Ash015763 [Apostasia shenzhenica]|uniref:Uncharacterized protein n=1 Tax=Apostasia shenzhenica TaxID=1088818 RepID=A0A2H9ZU94_9ASPA|nr:hypothetical protein AXF42_Ash015763 [Apostasia shenzhenica]
MEGKRLDLDAPLLSFRRITVPAAGVNEGVVPPLRKTTHPFGKPELKNSPVGSAGAVPFEWEKTPGQPKDSSGGGAYDGAVAGLKTAAPKLPPGRSLKEKEADWIKDAVFLRQEIDIDRKQKMPDGGAEKAKMEEEWNLTECDDDGESFSDARDTLSCTESFSMKCSATGMSANFGARNSFSDFSKDQQGKGFMIDRFLPAAQAMAARSPRRTWRKPPRAPEVAAANPNPTIKTVRRRESSFHYECQVGFPAPNANDQDEVENDDDGDHRNHDDNGYFSPKVCGLLPRCCLKSSFFLLNPVPGMKVQSRHPVRPPNKPSPLSHNDANLEDSWEAVYRYKLNHGDYIQKEDGSKLASESNQLTYWSDSQTLDDSSSLQHSSGAVLSPNKNGDPESKSQTMKTGSYNSCEEYSGSYWDIVSCSGRLQEFSSTSPSTDKTLFKDPLHFPITSKCEGKKETNFINNISGDGSVDLKAIDSEKSDNYLALSLLPPPLPNCPSESWLKRTLPRISSRGPHQQSFLGIQIHRRKPALQAGRDDLIHQKLAREEKLAKALPRRTRFAEVAKPQHES